MKLPLKDKKFLFLLVSVLIVVSLEVLSLTGIHIPMPYAPFVFGVFIIAIGRNVLIEGIKAIFKLRFSSINLLMTIAVIAAYYLGEYPEAAVVIVLYTLSEELETIGIKTSKTALDDLIAKAPKEVMIKGGALTPIGKVEPGTVIEIRPGDYIPLDGVITYGNTTIDEAPITGEPIPKDKHVNDLVYAGTVNKNGYIEVKSTKKMHDTAFSKILRLTFEAQMNKSKTQQFIQKFSKIYTPTIIVIAALVLIIPVVFYSQSFDKWLTQAVSLLVIACPCALVISTPVAIYAAIGNASSRGILIKGGKFLELLAKVKVIALDKTRTLTYGKPVVSDLIPLNTDKEELLSCAAGAEVFSEHPLAQAIVDASLKEGLDPHKAHNFKSITGKGAIAECLVCEDETIFVGKLSFIKEHQPVTSEAEKIVAQLSNQGKTSVVVSFGDGVAGIIGLMDEIKPDSIEAINGLKSLGVEPVILTGDNENTARFVAGHLGIERVYGGLLPEQKSEIIQKLLKESQYVAMVGDGINDAPALAMSTVGIAMGAVGSDTAIETADIALMNDKISLLPFLVRLSRKTLRRIKFNTAGAILVKLIFITLAFLGFSNLVFAIAADVGVTLIVILTSLSLMKFEGTSTSPFTTLHFADQL